ncbi:MAG: Holliday junction branch migration protein RuvA [candidate division KSB1 bacterium]|nr:Holliday junction branch migration protein RuvA [candidate division KSB1 bacterium]MDZ7303090.1 Holliday junction branch migration protein RuvA [candidate division KSB1 bacterium]MDZ7312629.1 Holliday junction branch migration protein RuvA [candidate division KSB1 bacterium]
MIAKLNGRLLEKSPTRILVDVGGVGYEIHIPLSTFDKLGQIGDDTSLFTHLHVREDALQLFGFATATEKQLFQYLLSVTGIGPKVAQSILSGCSVDTFCRYIVQNEISALTTIPGIGKKTAERLVLELKDRLQRWMPQEGAVTPPSEISAITEEAILALTSLGYKRPSAQKAIEQVIKEHGELPIEELIKRALHYI